MPALILLLGVFGRLIFLYGHQMAPAAFPEEPVNVAAAIVTRGEFADAYVPGGGPTAHLAPLTPLLLVVVYWLFGVNTVAANNVLSVIDIFLVVICAGLTWQLFRLLDASRWARLLALAIVSLVPLQFDVEVRQLRNWEQLPALCLMLGIFCLIVSADRMQRVERARLVWLGALTGLLMLLNPSLGLAALAALMLFLSRRTPWRSWVIAGAAFWAVVLAVTIPWTIRNQQVMGSPIALRDNLGLELNLSNHSGMIDGSDPAQTYRVRLDRIHPNANHVLGARLHEMGGELAYNNRMMTEARAWIGGHPGAFLGLCVRRAIDFYFPPRWFWGLWGGRSSSAVPLKQAIFWFISAGGLISLAVLARRRAAYGYLLAAILTAVLPYLFVQPIFRYRYVVSGLLIFAVCDGLVRLATHAGKRSRRRSSGMPAIPLQK